MAIPPYGSDAETFMDWQTGYNRGFSMTSCNSGLNPAWQAGWNARTQDDLNAAQAASYNPSAAYESSTDGGGWVIALLVVVGIGIAIFASDIFPSDLDGLLDNLLHKLSSMAAASSPVSETRSARTTGSRYATVSAGNLHLRSGPGTQFDPIATMPHGLRVTVIGSTANGWLEVEAIGTGGQISHGFARSKFLTQ